MVSNAPVKDIHPLQQPRHIQTPNGTMMATHHGTLCCATLPPAARDAMLVPDPQTQPLLSIGQLCNAGCGELCDAGCETTFAASDATVVYQDWIVLQGTCENKLRKFSLPGLPDSGPLSAFAAIPCTTPAVRVAFAHASLFSPAVSTLTTALEKGFLRSFPGLTLQMLKWLVLRFHGRSVPW